MGRGLIESADAQEMAGYQHGGGFSVDAGVCIAAADRAGLERLLRYCARPAFAMERLRQRGADLVYHCPKPQAGGKRADLVLTPLELIDRPPPWCRHRTSIGYFGGLAPNAPLRAAVTTMAQVGPVDAKPAPTLVACGAGTGITVHPAKQSEPAPQPRSTAHYLWAMLIARIYEVFPLVCPLCAGQMRIIAFIIDGAE